MTEGALGIQAAHDTDSKSQSITHKEATDCKWTISISNWVLCFELPGFMFLRITSIPKLEYKAKAAASLADWIWRPKQV